MAVNSKVEKVYVVVGDDSDEGLNTLDWALKKWKPNPISIVILHLSSNISKDPVFFWHGSKHLVDTPFGKLPTSSMTEGALEIIRKYEQGKMDRLFSKYREFCREVKTEILKIERSSDEPIERFILDLISKLKITKLVMRASFLKASGWKSKSGTTRSFYKLNDCDVFVMGGRKLGMNEDEFMAKKENVTSWFGKKSSQGQRSSRSSLSPESPGLSTNSNNQWELFKQEIDKYFEHLVSLKLDEEIGKGQNDNLQVGSVEAEGKRRCDSAMSVGEKLEYRVRKMDEAPEAIHFKREEAKANAERRAKAESATRLCNGRVEELEAMINEEVTSGKELTKNLVVEKNQTQKVTRDVAERKTRLSSLVELQSELSEKLQMSSLTRVRFKSQLEKAEAAKVGMVKHIEELQRQRDVLLRRIEFCKENDAMGMEANLSEVTCGCREYSADEIRLATNDFSESQRLKSCCDWKDVYQGRIDGIAVAIKRFTSDIGLTQEKYVEKVKVTGSIHHPHLVSMVGFCSELQCIVFEGMRHSLRELILSGPGNNMKRNLALSFHDRIRIAGEVCTGLGFLHSMKPKPIVHGRLTAASVLLDHNLVAKITGFGQQQRYDEHDAWLDIRAFGFLLLHLLAGTNWAKLAVEAMTTDEVSLTKVLDEIAGQWPLDLAKELVGIALKCLSLTQGPNSDINLVKIREQLEQIREKANDATIEGAKGGDGEKVPSIFICPIYQVQEVMKDPYIAADGISYEKEAIEEWLNMGRDTSPTTNLKLSHKSLVPNHNLLSLIQDWYKRKP